MTYTDILLWAKRGLIAEIDKQIAMLNDVQSLDTPSAPALRELLNHNADDLRAQLNHVEDLLKDPSGNGR